MIPYAPRVDRSHPPPISHGRHRFGNHPRFGRRSRTAASAARAHVQPPDDGDGRAGARHLDLCAAADRFDARPPRSHQRLRLARRRRERAAARRSEEPDESPAFSRARPRPPRRRSGGRARSRSRSWCSPSSSCAAVPKARNGPGRAPRRCSCWSWRNAASALDRDVQTAIVALESADARLAALRDQSVAPVRQQIARELQALRAVRQPDTIGVLARLASAEEAAARLPIKGILATERRTTDRAALPEGKFARAWAMTRNAFANLIVVRTVDDQAGSIVTAEEAQVRRQHLQLLLFAARTAVARHDATAYRDGARRSAAVAGRVLRAVQPGSQGAARTDPAARARRHRSAAAGHFRIVASAAAAAARASGSGMRARR